MLGVTLYIIGLRLALAVLGSILIAVGGAIGTAVIATFLDPNGQTIMNGGVRVIQFSVAAFVLWQLIQMVRMVTWYMQLRPEERARFQAHYFSSVSSPLVRRRSRHIPQDVKVAVAARDGGACRVCGSKSDLHFDHIIPYSKSGSSDDPRNIQLLCGYHNRRKSNR